MPLLLTCKNKDNMVLEADHVIRPLYWYQYMYNLMKSYRKNRGAITKLL